MIFLTLLLCLLFSLHSCCVSLSLCLVFLPPSSSTTIWCWCKVIAADDILVADGKSSPFMISLFVRFLVGGSFVCGTSSLFMISLFLCFFVDGSFVCGRSSPFMISLFSILFGTGLYFISTSATQRKLTPGLCLCGCACFVCVSVFLSLWIINFRSSNDEMIKLQRTKHRTKQTTKSRTKQTTLIHKGYSVLGGCGGGFCMSANVTESARATPRAHHFSWYIKVIPYSVDVGGNLV